MITADTNVFVYLADDGEPSKQRVAGVLVAELVQRRSPIGLQVVGEVQNAVRRKLKRPFWESLQMSRKLVQSMPTFAYDQSSVEAALDEAERGALSYWDALLVTSARRAGIRVLLSEDMQDGARFGELEIVNPFAAEGLSIRAQAVLRGS